MSAYGSCSHHTGSLEDLSVLSNSQNAPPRSMTSGHSEDWCLSTDTHLLLWSSDTSHQKTSWRINTNKQINGNCSQLRMSFILGRISPKVYMKSNILWSPFLVDRILERFSKNCEKCGLTRILHHPPQWCPDYSSPYFQSSAILLSYSEKTISSQSLHESNQTFLFISHSHLSLQAPIHSCLPHGFLMRMRGMVSFLKKASRPCPSRTFFTAVTEYAWPLTRPFAKRSSRSWGDAWQETGEEHFQRLHILYISLFLANTWPQTLSESYLKYR